MKQLVEITVFDNDNGQVCGTKKQTVAADVFGFLAVHKSVEKGCGRSYTITHLPTGLRVFEGFKGDKKGALLAAETANNLTPHGCEFATGTNAKKLGKDKIATAVRDFIKACNYGAASDPAYLSSTMAWLKMEIAQALKRNNQEAR